MQVGKIDQIWKDTSAAVTGPCNTLVVIELNVGGKGGVERKIARAFK